MASFKVSEILKATGGKLLQGDPALVVRGVSTNSRLVKKGELFIAIVGQKYDAHSYIPAAIKKGACAVVVLGERGPLPLSVAVIKVADTTKALGDIARFHRLRFSLPVIAITGSAGKTTTKEMISSILKRKFKVLKNIGTENNQYGVPLTLLKLNSTHQIAVLEVGTNRPGDIAWLASIVSPTVAVMTNIGESHLALLKTPADVFKEKFNLVKSLNKDGIAVINADDNFFAKIARDTRKKVIAFAIKSKADFCVRQISFESASVKFSLSGTKEFVLPGTATAGVYNALAAISVSRLFKVGWEDIKSTLKKFSLDSGRQTVLKAGEILVVDDSYNANPVSFRSALEALGHQKTLGRKILVCADMLELGRQAKALHCAIGSHVSEAGVNMVISFGDLSRWIGISAKEKNPKLEVFHSANEEDIFFYLKRVINPLDIILVKGSRSMHTERFVEFIKENFK